MPCCNACPSRYLSESKWCEDCRRDFERYMDDHGTIAQLALAAQENDQYVPCSDEEWTRHWDEVAPVVTAEEAIG